MKVQLTKVSGNKKTGPIPVSTTTRDSCPTTCSWYTKGCYAKYGPLHMHWQKVEERGTTWDLFVQAVAKLPRGQLWRHNQAGDLPGLDTSIDGEALKQLVTANRGKRGFTYTHKPPTPDNLASVKDANERGFTINLSADNLAEADKLAKHGVAPVVVVLPKDSPLKVKTPEGRHVIVCPAEYAEDMSCSRCGLCAISSRKAIVGFRAHGAASKTVSQRASLNILDT